IGADKVWNALNIDGAGVVVANLDTGVDWQHPALLSKYRGYRNGGPAVHFGNWYDATNGGYVYPGDGIGHGTHTMGTIVGGTPDRAIGVAPGAQWIAVKIFANNGYAADSWIHAGFQWVIAPEGDPSLAPDILSNSWGTDNGYDTAFEGDVSAVRAAGILPVFANGNAGTEGGGSVGAPASYPESFAVGATDANDVVAYFSSRGPSPLTQNVKPDISAPGVNVTSAFAGGGYRALNGTSMATPHIAGVAALLKQAQPSISVDGLMFVITTTATPLSATLPNNDTGWGRVDAYAAVLRVAASGLLSGTISRASLGLTSGSAPIANAQIVATDRVTRTTQTMSDANGGYQLPLSEDRYNVSVFAFGYAPSLNNVVWISNSQTTIFNADLNPLPSANVRGHITEVGSGAPLSATVSVLNTPVNTLTDATGFYSLTLPTGTWTLRAASWAHRIATATITLQDGDVITRDLALASAPTILLVDSGAWYYGSEIRYYQTALDALGYLYQTHVVTNPVTFVPTFAEMKTYSITIWSSPQDSPNYLGAGQSLIDYLDQGGRLFLSGQDIAYFDGGGPGFVGYDYFPFRLHGRFVNDTTVTPIARGVTGEALQGITFTINTTDSARNQFSPDEVAPTDDNARPLAAYQGGQIAGLAASTCLPYRAAYLGFGFEGVGPAAVRQQAMQNIVDWLMASPPLRAFALSSDAHIAIGQPGNAVTHALTLRNVGQLSDSYALTLSGNLWPTTLWNGDFTQPLTSPVTLASCASQPIGLRTDIPANATRNTTDVAQFNALSLADATLTQTRTLTSKTPAPVLLVDADRWYEQEAKYIAALNAQNIAFDFFDTHGGVGPATATMQMYPVVVWFSGYDWFDPLSAANENRIAAYLNSGGRLFYTAQDYLDVRFGKSSFAPAYLGVLTYTNDVTVTTVGGIAGNPVSDGLGPYALTYPYFNFSDYLTPTVGATPTFIGNPVSSGANGSLAPSALQVYSATANFKTVFFAFPFETLPVAQRPTVMNSVVGWLSPLGDTTLVAPTAVTTNTIVTYRLQPRSSNLAFASSARITVTLPASVTLGALGDPSLTYDAPSRSVWWSGTLSRASLGLTTTPPLTWTVLLDPAVAPGAWLTATTTVHDTDEGLVFARATRTFVERT
ncbi:MAG: S8 family serine peptidase, partial [Chloroflexota bacterium]